MTKKQCAPDLHQLIRKLNSDGYCSCCGQAVNPDAVVNARCEQTHAQQMSRGAKHCYDCGEALVLA